MLSPDIACKHRTGLRILRRSEVTILRSRDLTVTAPILRATRRRLAGLDVFD